MVWALIEPLMLLCIYTFVFSVIFKGNWSSVAGSGITSPAPILFMGLITFGLFADVASQAPSLILQQRNYVKKVVFPLEVLPVVSISSALITALFSLAVLLVGLILIYHAIPVTILLLPLAWLPVLLFSLGFGYFLASVGVFIRDMNTFVNIFVLMLRFMTPLFYPVSMVPEVMRPYFEANPLAIFVDTARRVALWGVCPDWKLYLLGTLFSLIVLMFGFMWFMASKHAFADVI